MIAPSTLASLRRIELCLLSRSLEFQKRMSADPNFYNANLSREGFSPFLFGEGPGVRQSLRFGTKAPRKTHRPFPTSYFVLYTLYIVLIKFYPKSGIAYPPQTYDFWNMSPCASHSTNSTCIVMQLMAHSCAKKKECCKKYKHGKRCKKCPKSSK